MILLHGIASRHDLPLPFWMVVMGGAVVLVATFWVALFAWRSPRFEERCGRPLPRLTALVDARGVSRALRIVVAAVWLVALIALLFGVDRIDNPVFGFVYVWLWVGLVPASLLLGQVYRRTNPWRLLFSRSGATAPAPYESTVSVLPAALALLVFSYLELIQPGGATLPVLRVFATGWVVWMVVGTLATSQRWIARADPFEAYASTVSRLSPWGRSRDGVIVLLNPLRNLASWKAPRHLAILCSVLLGGTLFDALSNTTWWVRSTQGLGDSAFVVATLALACCVAVVILLFRLGTLPYRNQSMDALAPGLVPLVVGYALSHYSTMLYLEGQRTLFRFSDPVGRGWNLFGMVEASPGTALFGFPMVVALAQVALIVGGHLLGVLVTHDIALRSSPGSVKVHLPLLLVMVAFTVGGLLLMFGG